MVFGCIRGSPARVVWSPVTVVLVASHDDLFFSVRSLSCSFLPACLPACLPSGGSAGQGETCRLRVRSCADGGAGQASERGRNAVLDGPRDHQGAGVRRQGDNAKGAPTHTRGFSVVRRFEREHRKLCLRTHTYESFVWRKKRESRKLASPARCFRSQYHSYLEKLCG